MYAGLANRARPPGGQGGIVFKFVIVRHAHAECAGVTGDRRASVGRRDNDRWSQDLRPARTDGGGPASVAANHEWRFETAGPVRGSPAVGDTTIYVGSNDGALYAIDRSSGTERWAFRTDSARVLSPTLSGETVVVASRSAVFALDARTGERRWRYDDQHFVQPPHVVDGDVFAFATDRNGWRCHALELSSGAHRWEVDETVEVGDQLHSNLTDVKERVLVATWRAIRAFDRRDGTHTSLPQPQSVEAMAELGDVCYAGIRSSDGAPNVRALEVPGGRERWSTTTRAGEWITAVVTQDDVVYASGIEPHDDGTKTRRVSAMRATDGAILWSTVTSAGGTASVPPRPVGVGDRVVAATGDRHVALVDAEEGQLIGRVTLEGFAHTRPAIADGTVYVGGDDGTVYAIPGER